VRVYDPKHFVWLGLVFSAMVPIYLAASNWGKVGQSRTKRRWLGLGFVGFVLLLPALTILPGGELGDLAGKAIGLALNVGFAHTLRDKQRPLYRAALRLGARPGSLVLGTVMGVGLLVCAIGLAFGGYVGAHVAAYEWEFQRGVRLADQGEYDEAVAVFETMVREDPEDAAAMWELALCHFNEERWIEATQVFENYLRLDEEDPEAWVYLSTIRYIEGRSDEAESLASQARALDPEIFDKMLQSDTNLKSKLDFTKPAPAPPR
jgi:tetratricopeptide (TPR) repeat protein